MKLFTILSLLFSLNAWADGPIPGTGTATAVLTNPAAYPTANSVIQTTPALTSGSVTAQSANWVVAVQVHCSVSALIAIQTLNASGTVVNTVHRSCNVPTGGTGGDDIFNVPEIAYGITQSFKVQVANVTAIASGTVEATIFYGLQTVNP